MLEFLEVFTDVGKIYYHDSSMASAKPTTCKEAIRRWEEENQQTAATATEVILSFQWPPIEKMDNALASLVNCEKLSLSTNMIEKVAGKI